jgi:hypothetical protein
MRRKRGIPKFDRWLWADFVVCIVMASWLYRHVEEPRFGCESFRWSPDGWPMVGQPVNYAVVNGMLPRELLIYTVCNEFRMSAFSLWRTSLPHLKISCNPYTRWIDCHEAVGYLTFAIETYDRPLARRYLFIHAHDRSWHYNRNVFDALDQCRKSNYYKEQRYGAIFPDMPGTGPWGRGKDYCAKSLYYEIFNGTSMPANPIRENNLRPCCATFFMDSELIRTRPKAEYILIRDRLRTYSLRMREEGLGRKRYSIRCSWLMEWNWHIMFANRSNITIVNFFE